MRKGWIFFFCFRWAIDKTQGKKKTPKTNKNPVTIWRQLAKEEMKMREMMLKKPDDGRANDAILQTSYPWKSTGEGGSGRNKTCLKSMFLKEQWRDEWLLCFALIREHTAINGVNWSLKRNTIWEAENFLSDMNLSQAAGSQVVLRHPGSA